MAPEAQRRDTPAEGMPAVAHVQEQDDHFVVTFADGTSTTVLKKGLKDDTLAHIQGMAHGGLVIGGGSGIRIGSEGISPGEEVSPAEVAKAEGEKRAEEDEEKRKRERARNPEAPQHLAAGGEVAAQPPALPQMSGDIGDLEPSLVDRLMGGPPQAKDLFAFPPINAAMQYLQQNTPATSPGGQALSAVGYAPPPGGTFDPLTGERQPEPRRGVVDLRGADKIAPLPAPSAQAAPASGLPALPSGGSGALTELNKGLAEQRSGLAAQVETEKARDAALMQLQDKHIAQMQALEAQQAEQTALHQKRADDLFMAVQNGKVDPNRVWANADIGQKIGAGIGIILSGIGVGLAGGPNLALQVIDRTIDRDIDAQKTNLENQKGLLSYYLQQGRDMLSAHALAKADLKDMLAAQVSRVSAEFGGQEAAARAQMVGGQLRTEAAGKRQEILARDFQMQTQRAALGAEMERNRVLSAIAGAMGKPGAIPSEVWEVVPKDMRERRVHLPNGGWGLAKDATQATKLQEGLEKVDEFKRVLGRYTGILQDGSPRLPTGIGGDKTQAQQYRATLQALLKDAESLGAMSVGDYEFIDRQIPDISEWFTSGKAKEAGLGALGSTVDARVAARLKTLGMQ